MALGSSYDDYDTIGSFRPGPPDRAPDRAPDRTTDTTDRESVTSTRSVKKTMQEFSAETTFHGIKFIFEDTPFILRRLLWTLLTIAALGGFVFLVVIKTQQFLRHESQIDLEQTFLPEARFPKVTICNQNPHRMTALHQLGMLDVVLNTYEAANGMDPVSKYTPTEGGCIEHFRFMASECEIARGKEVIAQYNQVSLGVCKNLCMTIHAYGCNGIYFERKNNLCVITSLTGDRQVAKPNSERNARNMTTNGIENIPISTDTQCSGSVVYLRRKRCTDIISFRCHFEESCDVLIQENTSAEKWLLVAGRDNTLTYDTGKGNYMFLVDSSLRPGVHAVLHTPFMDTTGKCLMVHVRFFGVSVVSQLGVFAENEKKDHELAGIIRGSGRQHDEYVTARALWRPWLVPLPDGVNRVVIDGQRADEGSSGIGLDDVEINLCQHFYRECRHSARGTDYLGKQNTTMYGASCLPWSDPRVTEYLRSAGVPPLGQPGASLTADLSAGDMENYCRNPDGDLAGPWCVTGVELQRETCDVQFCPCQEGWFQCGDGSCIPGAWTCNGVSDCFGAEDETTTECQSEIQLSCGFEDLFMCGYTFPNTGNVGWVRQLTNRDISAENVWAMAVVPVKVTSNMGDRVLMISPAHTFTRHVQVEFDARLELQTKSTDLLSELEVTLISDTGVPTRRLWATGTSYPSPPGGAYQNWATYSVCVSPGDHRLGFLFTSALDSEVLVDNVVVTDKPCYLDPEERPNESVECDFDSDLCGYRQQSNSVFFEWKRIPLMYVTSALENVGHYGGCSGEFYDVSGTITSENFPHPYGNDLSCLQTIRQPPGTTTSITFDVFDIEDDTNCEYDSLVLSGGTSMTLCGNMAVPPINSTEPEITLLFQTDGTVTFTGFQFQYEAVTSPGFVQDTDYAIAVSFRGVEPVFGPLLSKLVSPIGDLSEVTCLTLDVMVLSPFSLTLETRRADGEQTGSTPLLSIARSMGKVWKKLSVDLVPPDDTEHQMFLVFSSQHTGDQPQYTAVINDIMLEPGRCRDKVNDERGNVTCDYSTDDQCGYMDISRESVRWLRVDLDDNGFGMGASFTEERSSGVLLSPEVTVEGDACLTFRSNLTADLTLLISVDERKNDMLTHYHSEGDISGQVSLPNGTYRVMFTAIGQGSEQFITLWDTAILNRKCQTNGLGPDGHEDTRSKQIAESADETLEPTLPLRLEYIDNRNEVREEELHTLQGLIEYHKNDDFRKFLVSTVQERDHFIASCKFEGRDCDPDAWDVEFTDLFACYEFNPDKEDPLYTNVTGAENGLKMMLNVENYEHVPGLTNDAGIKVYVGPQDDVPLMRSMGMAMAPGTHTLAAIGRLTEDLMVPPYGSCGQKDLTYYPLSNYTYNRCYKDCKATALANKCGCSNVDVHLNTSTAYCDVEDYLGCLVPDIFSSEAVSCDCFGACYADHYTSQLSYSRLSILSPDTIIPDEIPKLEERFYEALNLRERNVAQKFATTVGRLDSLLANVKEYREKVNNDFKDSATSHIGVLNTGLNKMGDDLLSDLDEFYGQSDMLWEVYAEQHKPTFDTLLESLEMSVTKLNVVDKISRVVGYQLDSTGFTTILSNDLYLKTMEATRDELELTSALLDAVMFTNGIVETGSLVRDLEPRLYLELQAGWLPQLLVKGKDRQRSCRLLASSISRNLTDSVKYVGQMTDILRDAYLGDTSTSTVTPPSDTTTSTGTPASYTTSSTGTTPSDSQITDTTTQADNAFSTTTNEGLSGSDSGIGWGSGSGSGWGSGWESGSGSGLGAEDRDYIYSVFGQLKPEAKYLALEYTKLVDCLTEYQTYLETIKQHWSDLRATMASYKTLATSSIDLNGVETDIRSLKTIINRYSRGDINKYQLSSLLQTTLIQVEENVQNSLSELGTQAVEPINTELEQRKSKFVTLYEQLLEHMLYYQEYFPDKATELKRQLAYLSVWRIPYANIRKEDVRFFRKTVAEGVQSVPPNTQLFMDTTGPLLARTHVEAYFTELTDSLAVKYKEMSNVVDLIRSDINDINEEMKQFVAGGEIDEDFISQNYLQLDIYYGLLKKDNIKQKKEYDLSTFFSDFGGFMGLLLGGSVISLAEILDALIYNAALKRRHAAHRERAPDDSRNVTYTHRESGTKSKHGEFTDFVDPSVRVKNYYPGLHLNKPGGLPRFVDNKVFTTKPGEVGYKQRKTYSDGADDYYARY